MACGMLVLRRWASRSHADTEIHGHRCRIECGRAPGAAVRRRPAPHQPRAASRPRDPGRGDGVGAAALRARCGPRRTARNGTRLRRRSGACAGHSRSSAPTLPTSSRAPAGALAPDPRACRCGAGGCARLRLVRALQRRGEHGALPVLPPVPRLRAAPVGRDAQRGHPGAAARRSGDGAAWRGALPGRLRAVPRRAGAGAQPGHATHAAGATLPGRCPRPLAPPRSSSGSCGTGSSMPACRPG